MNRERENGAGRGGGAGEGQEWGEEEQRLKGIVFERVLVIH